MANRSKRPRRYTEEDFRSAVADPDVRTIADLCRRLGIVPRGGNYEVLRDYARSLGIDPDERFPRASESPWQWSRIPDEEVIRAVAASESIAEALRLLGRQPTTAGRRFLRRRIDALGIDTTHHKGAAWSAGRRFPERERGIETYLVEGRRVQTNKLRQRLIREGLKERRCEGCGCDTWQGLPVPLELNHRNGRRDDNRLGNLELLCPNCHAQTPTYRGRNIGNT